MEDQNLGRKNFAFKCHRENNDIYAVNSISFHPTFGTFSTAGADGSFHFWDKDSKSRCAQFKKCDAPIVSSAFNRDGSAFAYAVSYDWSKGNEYYNKNYGSHIMIKFPNEKDVRPKKKKYVVFIFKIVCFPTLKLKFFYTVKIKHLQLHYIKMSLYSSFFSGVKNLFFK